MAGKSLKDRVFQTIHSRNLVYNTCWEDPRCDRQLLQLNDQSEVVMITSAGCNALDYLLDDPKKINCIDMNPRQNALLELKRATLTTHSFKDHFSFFGNGRHSNADAFYQEVLRPGLPDFAKKYWDKNIDFFNGKGIRKTFYHYGTSGTFAWLVNNYLKTRPRLRKKIKRLFEAESLEEQKEIYFSVESKVLNRFVEWFMNKHLTMCMLGVPQSQQELFATKYKRGVVGFMQECLRQVFTEISTRDNYFWRLYTHGEYTTECSPEYLKESNYQALGKSVSRVQTHTNTISGFLKENPGTYSHFVLLDHQDWLAANDQDALEEEWNLILANSRPGTRILLRSAAAEVNFFPEFVMDALTFEQELTQKTHAEDRVGTYASVYLGIVN
jgi:S-adenosylmethionine-diacylglycerol 3-amino-3-carboxypropyl transferase